MIVDTSALVAILQREPERDLMLAAMAQAERRLIAAPNWLEMCLVIDGRANPAAQAAADTIRTDFELDVIAFDASMAEVAREAYRRYGRGNHPAKLNFGDCMAYALAKSTAEPLLFKGQDFTQTDIAPALA